MSTTNNSSTALQTFTFEDTTIRAGMEDDEPWFVAADVAKALGYKTTQSMLRQLDDAERGIRKAYTPGGPQKMATITEAGLYRIILKREAAYVKDPAARAMVTRFQWWVTHEVLPSLRKTGAYSLPASAPAPATLSGKALLAAAVLEAQKTIENLEAENRALKPKALFADAVGAGENTLTMPQMAKILSSHGFPGGVVKLYRRLREDHVVYRKQGRNLPCQRYVDAGLFTARISPFEAKGHHYNGVTTLVTPKGSRWLAARYCPTAAALEKSDTPVLEAAPAPTWQNAFFVEEERAYQGEGYPTLHVFNNRAEADTWAAAHHGRPVDNRRAKTVAGDIAGLRVEALGWTWDGSLNGLRALPGSDDARFVQAVADVYALDAGPWTGNIIFHC